MSTHQQNNVTVSWNTKKLRKFKRQENARPLSMLTCYDFQTAQMLAQTDLDLILVGDSLGNVVLGHDTTLPVTLDHMILFSQAVKKGAPKKFIIVDMPFGTYYSVDLASKNAIKVMQETGCQAIKLEGADENILSSIKTLKAIGIPVIGHIGLTPQSVHEMGGYYMHGKAQVRADQLTAEARALQDAGAFAIVLECVWPELAKSITDSLEIPTIGIGSGNETDGQVLVINDLLGMGKNPPPSFVQPRANLYQLKKTIIEEYLQSLDKNQSEESQIQL
jgi:3-methyl-2-oxobutanoate hydroxymethyltransferase